MGNSKLPTLQFGKDKDFEKELHRRVNEYFRNSGTPVTAPPGMYFKSFLVLSFFAATYLTSVFLVDTLWGAFLTAPLLGFAVVGIGVNIQHDASHKAYSKHGLVNRTLAMTLDIIGAGSYFWRWKHNRFHHTFTNIAGFDTDIDFGFLGRIAPSGKRLWFHRRQHLYMWFLYALFAVKWHVFDDFRSVIRGRLGNHRIPRPGGLDLAGFIAGKAAFLSLAFVIPSLFHPLGNVVLFYLGTMSVAGFTLSLIFIMPHTAGESEFPRPDEDTGRIANPRAVHQCRVTVDFLRSNPVATWLVGGLNFHREHHLFPRICHMHYRKIAPIVDEVCEKYGVPHVDHKSYWAGLRSHYHWLREMGSTS